MRRTFEFGKIDATGRGRKAHLVEVKVELRENKNGFPVFSASGNVWNHMHTDIIIGGQCLDSIKRVPMNNALFQEIKALWMKYHLNDMHAGTKAQEAALRQARIKEYSAACEYLKKKGLYEVRLTPTEAKYNPQYAGKPYRYGHGWLYYPIPATDLAKIRRIMSM